MKLFKKIFRYSKTKGIASNVIRIADLDVSELLKKISEMPSDERVQLIILLGDSGQLKYYEILKDRIGFDPDIHVKFAALKRIHFFKEHDDLIPFLKSLDKFGDKRNLEPYLSIALNRVGLINLEELNKRINRQQVL